MPESEWEREFLNRVQGIVNSHKRNFVKPLVLDIERTIKLVFEGWDPPDPDRRNIYRDLCFAADEGHDRLWLLGQLRDDMCNGMTFSTR